MVLIGEILLRFACNAIIGKTFVVSKDLNGRTKMAVLKDVLFLQA
jgi:hypothetical protein